MISFTITEKRLCIKNAEGKYFPFIEQDIETDRKTVSAMAVVCALLNERFKAGRSLRWQLYLWTIALIMEKKSLEVPFLLWLQSGRIKDIRRIC